MCQIIYKPGNFELPFDKLKSTCIVNPDGFGIMGIDRGKVVLRKHYDGKNDPEKLARVLEEYKSLDKVGVHVRFRTKGPVGCETCHPFEAYKDGDKRLLMMHNGTISGFGNDKVVDTEEYAKVILGPLYERTLKMGIDPFEDDLFEEINTKYLGSSNKLLLMNDSGFKIIGDKHGSWEKGDDGVEYWVSNTYSFNRTHREPSTTVWSYPTYNSSKKTSTTAVVPFTSTKKEETTEEVKPKRKIIQSFTDIANVEVEDLVGLTYDDIDDIVTYEPENAVLLIVQLLQELEFYLVDDQEDAE